jgi:hypothetical protein
MHPIALSFQHGERHCMPSSNTSSLVSSPFRTSIRRVASVSNIIARSSSSKVTTWRGSSFSAIAASIKRRMLCR